MSFGINFLQDKKVHTQTIFDQKNEKKLIFFKITTVYRFLSKMDFFCKNIRVDRIFHDSKIRIGILRPIDF